MNSQLKINTCCTIKMSYRLMENPVVFFFVCLVPLVCEIEDEACHIKGSEVCNLTFHATLDQFPSLRGCACAWEEKLCDSVQELAKQCSRKTGGVGFGLSVHYFLCTIGDLKCKQRQLCYITQLSSCIVLFKQ